MNPKKQEGTSEERQPCICCGQNRPLDMLDRNGECRLCSDNGHTSPLCKASDGNPAPSIPETRIEMALPLTPENVRKVVEYAEKMDASETPRVLTDAEIEEIKDRIIDVRLNGECTKEMDIALDDAVVFTNLKMLEKCKAEMDVLRKGASANGIFVLRQRIQELEQERERMLSGERIWKLITTHVSILTKNPADYERIKKKDIEDARKILTEGD